MALFENDHKLGFSLVEVIISVALFFIFAFGVIQVATVYLGDLQAVGSDDQVRALLLEGHEAIRGIRDRGWNVLETASSSLQMVNGAWVQSTTTLQEDVGEYARRVYIAPRCRDANDALVDCPAGTADIHTYEVSVFVDWPGAFGTSTAVHTSELTNWEAISWTQEDWSGGSGQSIFVNENRYNSADAQIQADAQVTLASGGGCVEQVWSFSDAGQYTYDPALITVAGGQAQLTQSQAGISGITIPAIETQAMIAPSAYTPKMLHVDGLVYLASFRGNGNDGYVRTFSLGANGSITNGQIDEWEFDTSAGLEPELVHIAGDVYAVFYRGAQSDGYIQTFSVDQNGTIGAQIDLLEFDQSDGREPEVIQVSADVYAIVYQGDGSDGFVRTVEIADNGTIDKTVGAFGTGIIDELEFETENVTNPEIISVGGDIYALAYRQSSEDDGVIRTIEIAANGLIDETPNAGLPNGIIDSLEFETDQAREIQMMSLGGGEYYGVVYNGPDDDGWVKTVRITAAGVIENAVVDTFEFDSADAQYPSVLHIENDLYAVAYSGAGSDGYVTLIEMTDQGQITEPVIAQEEFTDSNIVFSDMVLLPGDILAILYRSSGNDGYLTTLQLTRDGAFSDAQPSITPNTALSVAALSQWGTFTEVATTSAGSNITYQISPTGADPWYYWNGVAWAIAGDEDRNVSTTLFSELWSFSTSTKALSLRAFLESDGTAQAELSEIQLSCANFQYEVGQVVVDDEWTTVNLENNYLSPVVVASTEERANTVPQTVRVDAVTSGTFAVRLEHPGGDNLNAETVTYFVIEEGVWNVGPLEVEAGIHETATIGSSAGWNTDTVSFRRTFSDVPVVLHQVSSASDPTWVTSFVSDPDTVASPPEVGRMGIALNMAEVDPIHDAEYISWVALRRNVSTTVGAGVFEAVQTADTVTGHANGDACFPYSLLSEYAQAPLVIHSQQEMDGNDGGWSMMCSLDTENVGLHIEEDQQQNPERNHPGETVGFMAMTEATAYTNIPGGQRVGVSPSGELISSALNIDGASVHTVEWTGEVPDCNACSIRLQLAIAPDNGGSPGQWSDWYGASGAGTYFDLSSGMIVPVDLNGADWLRYRLFLQSDGAQPPTLQSLTITYK